MLTGGIDLRMRKGSEIPRSSVDRRGGGGGGLSESDNKDSQQYELRCKGGALKPVFTLAEEWSVGSSL